VALDKSSQIANNVKQTYAVHVISRKKLRQAAAKHREIESQLDAWYRIAKAAEWKDIHDVRSTYADADPVEGYTVFNVRQYRLIVKIEYRPGLIFIKHVLTHAEYDRGKWKK
jgi:mRNA interferase HigB